MDVSYLALGLMTRVEVESGDSEYETNQEFHRQHVTGAFRLEAGQRYDVPFRFEVPWETPLTELYGQHLHGMTMGLRTELEVARAVDKGDLDAVMVHPLPSQERILEALEEQVILLKLFGEMDPSMRVLIGDENEIEDLRTTSVVTTGYGPGVTVVGGMGVLGPTRMDYPGTIATVRAVARYVGDLLAHG